MTKTKTKVPTRTIHVDDTLHGQFKAFCDYRGIKIGAATEELIKCILQGTISGSTIARELQEFKQIYGNG